MEQNKAKDLDGEEADNVPHHHIEHGTSAEHQDKACDVGLDGHCALNHFVISEHKRKSKEAKEEDRDESAEDSLAKEKCEGLLLVPVNEAR